MIKESLSFNLAEWSLLRAILEVRYEASYRLWDCSGNLWEEVLSQFTEAERSNVKASPEAQTFRIGRHLELLTSSTAARVILHHPDPALRTFMDVVGPFFRTVVRALQVEVYTRLGLRRIYFRKYGSLEDASSAGFSLRASQLHTFGKGSAPAPLSRANVSVWRESSNLGVMVSLRTSTVGQDVDAPPDLADDLYDKVKEAEQRSEGLILDIDQYTTTGSPRDAIDVRQWAEAARETMSASEIAAALGLGVDNA